MVSYTLLQLQLALFLQASRTDMLRLVLMHIISQLRPGADLSRVVLPTFILEPRSMLERITKYVFAPFGPQGIVAVLYN